jgi:tetratricopeptide (TPR) repeat protein
MKLERPLLKLLFGSLLFCTTLVSGAQAATPYDDGMQDFNLKRYHAAEIAFENAVAKNAFDTRALMMLGKTREFLKDADGAKEAYSAAFKINPFNAGGAAAKQALLDLTTDVESKKHAPLDDAKTMRKTATIIQRQGQQLGQRYSDYGNSLAAARQRLTFDSYRGDQIRNGGLVNRRGFSRFRLTSGGDLSSWDRIQNAYRQYDDQAQALNYRTWATRNAVEARQSATNLVSLLADHGYATNPHLRALGTNLYVRNYESAQTEELPPEDPPLELRAKAWTFNDMPAQMQAKQKKL